MLRRVARVLRVGLFAAGLALLLYVPISFAYQAWLSWESDFAFMIVCEHGAIRAGYYWFFPTTRHPQPFGWIIAYVPESEVIRPDEPSHWMALLPQVRRRGFSLPLWLLAFICLAWPVASFIIHRRRHKRGFPVSVAPLPLGEVPSESASEAERASWN